MLANVLLLTLLSGVLASSTLNLKPLECQLVGPDAAQKFHVAPSPTTPGSRELVAAAQSGDAIFTFGGQDDNGFFDSLYAFGTGASGNLEWKLLRANKTMNSVGRFGTLKTMSTSNFPSARSGSCMDFVTSSHAILFGGRGIDSAGKEGFLNDLWVSEDLVQFGHYAGSKLANGKSVLEGKDATPSGRWKHTCAAHPETKTFVVFGGIGEHPANKDDTAILDDLFIYGEHGWTFLTGGSHSEVPDFSNKDFRFRNPGSRAEHASVMVESIFYTFGGQSVQNKPGGGLVEVMMGDLWAYNLITKSWSFVAGSILANTHGAYPAAIGVGGPSYGPGARVGAAMAFNQLTNELFIFGGFGYGYVPDSIGYLNDLWSFNTVSGHFSWLGGSAGINSRGAIEVGGSTFAAAIPSRVSALLFSGNDGYEAELTLIGGISEESKNKPEGIADVWMCNVQLPPSFTLHAPATTYPPAPHETEKPTAHQTVKPTAHETAKPTAHATAKPTAHATALPTAHATAKPTHTAQTEDPDDEDGGHHATTRTRGHVLTTGPAQSLFEAGSPQKVAALVLGSFIAILLLVGGIVFLGFAFVSSPATMGSRTVIEPYNAV